MCVCKIPGVSKKKKYGVENYIISRIVQYINVIIILRHGNYNFHLGVCKISLQYDKCNWYERNDGSKGTWMIKYACKFEFDSLSPV